MSFLTRLARRPRRPLALHQVEGLESRIVLDSTFFDLAASGPFTEDWETAANLDTLNNWDNVPSIIGFDGDDLTSFSGVDPSTVTADGTSTPIVVDTFEDSGTDFKGNVAADGPNAFNSGGITEFETASYPNAAPYTGFTNMVALKGSGGSDAPHLNFYMDTTGLVDVTIEFDTIDLVTDFEVLPGDDPVTSSVDAPLAVQYRTNQTGDYIQVDLLTSTLGPAGTAGLVTSQSVTLPVGASNREELEIRILTTNQAGTDEHIGIDNIVISGTPGVAQTFQVANTVFTPSMATATFNQPIDPSTVDLTAIGLETSSGVNVPGTVFVSDDAQSLTFVPTGGPLDAGNYELTINSGLDGILSSGGEELDGDRDGTSGGDAVEAGTVAPYDFAVSIPDFVRGPGQDAESNLGGGLPVTINDGDNVVNVSFQFEYDPNQLRIEGIAPGATLPVGATATINTVSNVGTALVTINSPTEFSSSSGLLEIANIDARVPFQANYGSIDLIEITNVEVTTVATATNNVVVTGEEAIDTRIIQSSGPRSGSPRAFFNIQGTGNGQFASYAIADFDIGAVSNVTDIVGNGSVTLTQSNAGFTTSNGKVDVYIVDNDEASLDNPTPLAYDDTEIGGLDSDDFAMIEQIGTFTFIEGNSGDQDVYVLDFASFPAGEQMLIDELNENSGRFRLAFAPDNLAGDDSFNGSSTYAGVNNFNFDGPLLDLEVASATAPTVNQGEGDKFIQVSSFLGDVNNNGIVNASDVTQLGRQVLGFTEVLPSFVQVDPVLVGDVSANGLLNATDTTVLGRFVLGTPSSFIPAIPAETLVGLSSNTSIIRVTGVREFGSGDEDDRFFNVQNNFNSEEFRSYGVIDYAVAGPVTAADITSLTLELTQDNAGFTRDGVVQVFVTEDLTTDIDSSINDDPTAIVYDSLAADNTGVRASDFTDKIEIGSYDFVQSVSGDIDVVTFDLSGSANAGIREAIADSINDFGTFRLLLTPENDQGVDPTITAATYAGLNARFGYQPPVALVGLA